MFFFINLPVLAQNKFSISTVEKSNSDTGSSLINILDSLASKTDIALFQSHFASIKTETVEAVISNLEKLLNKHFEK